MQAHKQPLLIVFVNHYRKDKFDVFYGEVSIGKYEPRFRTETFVEIYVEDSIMAISWIICVHGLMEGITSTI